LWGKKNAQAITLSGGLKRRLMIVRALVHEPEILILDEPTAGVDIEIRRSMWEFIRKINKEGKTIILTTHYLEEAENLCRNIAIINNGRIIENTSMKNLLGRMEKETFIFDVEGKIKRLPKSKKYKISILDETTIEVEASGGKKLGILLDYLKKNKIDVISMRRKTARLEELFMNLVNKDQNGI